MRRYAFLPGLLLLLSLLPLNGDSRNQHPLEKKDSNNILLITLDTTRADRLGCYGYQKASTPTLDTLASEGARFESAFSSVPLTLPSHVTMLTGLYPFRTGVRDNGLYRLAAASQTLAEILRSHGYRTMAFVSSAVLDRVFGLDQGFDIYQDNQSSGVLENVRDHSRTASEVNASVFANVGDVTSPFFLWVHYYDPHSPYVPPPPFSEQYAASPYDGEIAFVDSEIRDLLDHLESRKLLNNTMIVVAADHGENLGDHEEEGHGVFLYDSALRVPLIFHFRGVLQATSVTGLASLADLLPTILDYAGIKIPDGLDGVSLKEAIEKGHSNRTDIYQESLFPRHMYGWAPLFGIRTSRWHFVQAPRKEIYELSSDPFEKKNLAAQMPDLVASLEKKLSSYPYRDVLSTPSGIPEELREQIRSLGYVAPASTSQESTGSLDPKDGIALSNQIERAQTVADEGRLEEAISLLRDVLQKNPENVIALDHLGTYHIRRGDYQEAQQEFETALKYSESNPLLYFRLAKTLSSQGKQEAALQNFQKAISLNSRYGDAYIGWAELELSLKHEDRSLKILDQAVSLQVDDPYIYLMRGRMSAKRKDFAAAIKYYQMSLQHNADYLPAYSEMGHAYYKLHQIDQSIRQLEKALSIQPNNAWNLKALAYVYLHDKKDRERARECYQKALNLDPNGPDATTLRNLVMELSKQERTAIPPK